jgi:hypothetical protein
VFVCEDQHNLSRDFYGQPFSYRAHWLKKLCERARVEPFGLHAIRHLSASILDDAGYPITFIQALLRHRRATTTAKYLHKLRGLRVVLDEAFKSPQLQVALEIANAVSNDSVSRVQGKDENSRPAIPDKGSGRPFLRIMK